MRSIQSSEAKAKFAELLDQVAAGETLVITRRGEPVARIVPEPQASDLARQKVFNDIVALRRTLPKLSLDDILSARHEGHRA